MVFKDRNDAGQQLAQRLQVYKNSNHCVILAIPRGGLLIGAVLAKELNAPLDIILTKKIGHPFNSEYAIGAVSLFGTVLNPTAPLHEISKSYIEEKTRRIHAQLKERYRHYRGVDQAPKLKDKIVILTDDGLATGSTMEAAIDVVRQETPQKIIVAVPVGPPDTIRRLSHKADEMICLLIPNNFRAIGQFYHDFSQVDDEAAIRLLRE